MTKLFKAKLMRTDGTVEDVQIKASTGAIYELLDCRAIDTVRTSEGWLVVDDEGLLKMRPNNERASKLYPAPTGIAGPALFFTHAEWEAYDGAFGHDPE